MAPTINWQTGVITVQQSDTSLLTLVSGTIYSLDTLAFRDALLDAQDGEEGILWLDILATNPSITISGTVYVKGVTIINGYSITFAPDSQWTVVMDGATNNNFHDVAAGILNQNQVQVIPANAAGNTITETGVSGLTATEAQDLADLAAILRNRRQISASTGVETVYESDSATPRFTRTVYEDEAGSQTYRGKGVERAEKFS